VEFVCDLLDFVDVVVDFIELVAHTLRDDVLGQLFEQLVVLEQFVADVLLQLGVDVLILKNVHEPPDGFAVFGAEFLADPVERVAVCLLDLVISAFISDPILFAYFAVLEERVFVELEGQSISVG